MNKDNVVEQRKVEIGPLVGTMRVIDKGMSEDDRVVVARPVSARFPARRSIRKALRPKPPPLVSAAVRRRVMISKFFIERPVLANVIAILMVVIGLVSLISLPVAQYPDVTPPTVQVTTRYPGASARTVIDTVALPIEQQVNGVEGMIYMQSYAADDGSYSLTVTFAIGTDLNFAQVLVQNRVSAALSQLPQAVQVQGVTRSEEVDGDPADRRALFARRPLRQPLPRQLRDHPSEGRDFPPARRRQRHRVRRRPVFHARSGSTRKSCRRAA